MADFESALAYTLKNEGSEYTDDPADPGGPTRYGITQEDLSVVTGNSASPEEVKNVTEGQVETIYEKLYWHPLECDLIIDDGMATAVFDTGVLCGIGTCARIIQAIVGTTIDGYIGDETLSALNDYPSAMFINKLTGMLHAHYLELAKDNPKLQRFLTGWTARADRLSTLIK